MIVRHLGNGIVAFEDLVNYSKEQIDGWIERLEANSVPFGYQPISEDEELNSGGYRFTKAGKSTAPTRFNNFYWDGVSREDSDFVQKMEHSLYLALVEYCKLFPLAISELTWRTQGHIAKYEDGQHIGPHSDCAIPYEGDTFKPINLSPLYNTITASITLNDGFVGGELSFRTWGITHRPKMGTIIMYPSAYLGCHEVSPVTEGVRYSYLAWFCHGLPREEFDNPRPDQSKYQWLTDLKRDVGSENMMQKMVPVGILVDTDKK